MAQGPFLRRPGRYRKLREIANATTGGMGFSDDFYLTAHHAQLDPPAPQLAVGVPLANDGSVAKCPLKTIDEF
jgi:hypothetical protein